MAETRYQKEKKNHKRLKAKERGFFPSIQRNYHKKKKPLISDKQGKLL